MMSITGSTVVAENKAGVLLTYLPSVQSTLVEDPYGHCKPSVKKKRKRKTERMLNKGELELQKHHSQISEWLSSCHLSLSSLGTQNGYFPVTQPQLSSTPLVPEVDLVSLCNLDALTTAQEETSTYILKGDEDSVELFGHVISNKGSCDVTVSALGVRFTVPGQSSFLLSDVSKMHQLSTLPSQSFGLVVMDPPWENRSAIRGKKYSWLSNLQLIDLPVPGLLIEGAVVAVWVTNKRSIAQFVREILFPHWDIEYIAEWLWIKVTTKGELVWPMDSAHKKPYESLLIGRLRSANESDSPSGPPTKIRRIASGKLPPTQYSLMAVPSCIHSQKPYLGDVLDRYAPNGGGRLELFARNLLPGWTSWGNEVLKFQVQRT
ncbi:N(6)-adenine-specific methyltransferase METTL4-like isoform X2 [Halichondria panicea]|uniref:N(6)-adenine-specific methyltransferase METTL4-like isoform X2 n=1 Tax=Halichondria panicea TaxID=6063 RepID=UPI00312B9BC2